MKELVMLVGALLVLAVAPALAQQQTFRDAGGPTRLAPPRPAATRPRSAMLVAAPPELPPATVVARPLSAMLVGAPQALHGDELVTTSKVTIHGGELRRYSVPVRCTSHKGILLKPEDIDVFVFSTNPEDAKIAACEKMTDKYLRHQNKRTRWMVIGEPQES